MVVVERVLSGQQAEASDIQMGDQLVAVDQYNTTGASPKDILRLTSTLSWPRILTFETKGGIVDKKLIAEHEEGQTVNISVVFPPPLVAELQGRVADWTPHLDSEKAVKGMAPGGLAATPDACTIYYAKAASDQFGCNLPAAFYSLPDIVKGIILQKGNVNETEEEFAPMLTALLKESERRQVPVSFKAAAIMKRGVCNFVQKARLVASSNTGLGILVNTGTPVVACAFAFAFAVCGD